MSRKLGKSLPRNDPRTLKLANYLDITSLPIIPDHVNFGARIEENEWGVMANDRLGDCVIAAAGHQIQAWTSLAPDSTLVTLPDSTIIAGYSAVGGYVPGRPETDRGCVMLDALKYWRSTGFGGHKIAAFAAVNPKHHAMVRAAAWLFGGLYAGFGLPETAQSQAVWDYVPGAIGSDAYSWGGHGIYMHRITPGRADCVTWGYEQEMTDAFIDQYCDELYVCISDDWFGGGKTIHGFDVATLEQDLKLVTA